MENAKEKDASAGSPVGSAGLPGLPVLPERCN